MNAIVETPVSTREIAALQGNNAPHVTVLEALCPLVQLIGARAVVNATQSHGGQI
jgi:hypothetical protein